MPKPLELRKVIKINPVNHVNPVINKMESLLNFSLFFKLVLNKNNKLQTSNIQN